MTLSKLAFQRQYQKVSLFFTSNFSAENLYSQRHENVNNFGSWRADHCIRFPCGQPKFTCVVVGKR